MGRKKKAEPARPEKTTVEKLKSMIDASGLPHSEIALLAGMSKQQLYYLLKHPTADPKISTVVKILGALGFDLCDLENFGKNSEN